jgi:hypothetical protein
VRIDEQIRKCTAFIGTPNERGFRPDGTGFFASFDQDDFSFYYFITAAHLVWPHRSRSSSKKLPDGSIYMRINSKTGDPIVAKTDDNAWLFPTDKTLDVCALPTAWTGENQNVDSNCDQLFSLSLEPMALTERTIASIGLTIGHEVFITGAFVGRVGEKRNIPIVRIGNIAAMPEEPIPFASPRRVAYLIETRSLGGTSGSPVFLNTEPTKIPSQASAKLTMTTTLGEATKKYAVMPYFLVGMIFGSHSGQYAGDFISEEDTDIKPPKDVDFNAGISVAMTAADILDFVKNGAEMKTQRDAQIEKLRSESGSGASKAHRGSSKENPAHLEDFNRLVDVAARKRPQGDQT